MASDMAWFNKPTTDPANPDGKSDGDLLIEKLSAAIDAKLSPISTKVDAIQTRWDDALETAATRKPETPVEPASRVSVLDNEDEAFAQRLGPLAVQNAILAARLTENDIFAEMKESGWVELVPDVRRHLENTPIQRKAQADYPAYCRNVMDMVIGTKARTAGLRMNQSDKTFYLETGNTRGDQDTNILGSNLNWQDSRGRVHTGDEVAAKLGLSAEDAKAIGKEFLQ